MTDVRTWKPLRTILAAVWLAALLPSCGDADADVDVDVDVDVDDADVPVDDAGPGDVDVDVDVDLDVDLDVDDAAPDGAPPGHTEDNGGVMHLPGKEDPLANCVACHGADLRGGTAGSCYDCHNADDHTAGRGHRSGPPSSCETCHGPGNSGGLGPACSTCH
jgi:hypothetical protein